MNLQEIDNLIDDTKRLPRAADKVQLATALAVLEVARQLVILNETLAASGKESKVKPVKAGK